MSGELFTAQELLAEELEPIRWVVPGLLPEGLCILCGKPKTGKSWLMLDTALSIAAGTRVLGSFDVNRGAVLYLSLEDHKRRLQFRILKLVSGEAPPEFICAVEWPPFDQGGAQRIDDFLTDHPEIQLVVIDTLAKIRPKQKGSVNVYQEDHEFGQRLAALAQKHQICLVVIHHLRKMPADDPIDEVSGSAGLTGAADCIILLNRKRKEIYADMFVTGRDVEELDIKLAWDKETCRWTAAEDDESSKLSPERRATMKVLGESPNAMKPAEISEALNEKRESIKQLLHKMKREGQVLSEGNGLYTTMGAFINNPITDITDNHDNPDNHPTDDGDPVTPVIGNPPMPPDTPSVARMEVGDDILDQIGIEAKETDDAREG